RLALTPFAQEALRSLGRDTTRALEMALGGWRPGTTDREVQAEMVRQLEATGAEAVVALVAGDDRVARYRHPVALGLPAFERMMAVVVSRRGGLNVAATRFAAAAASADLEERFRAVRHVETEVLRACVPGATYGEATSRLVEAYGEIGHPEAWREHWQGGPIGYGTREFELAPGFDAAAFWSTPVATGHALAWNPSLAGGAKVEDTFLVTPVGPECVTAPLDWPSEEVEGWPEERAAVLVVPAGES
ncbi:MAG TPA: M24 family metallopeptidase, partial [Acidimicrobiales bacterium]|nr:M24 family metallopeptidase [Acidimicrobiales bacterium]